MRLNYPYGLDSTLDKVKFTNRMFLTHIRTMVNAISHFRKGNEQPIELIVNCEFALLYMNYVAYSEYLEPEYSSSKDIVQDKMHILIRHLTR